MKSYKMDKVRNVVLISHGGAGKTSLAEAMLFDAGAIGRLGRVDDGTATLDFDPDEIKRRMSVNLAIAPLEWRETKINIIDTPGYADFVGEVLEGIRAADAAIVVVDAVAGVQVGTEHTWKYADEQKLARLVFVNRMDRENADFVKAVDELRERFGTKVVPIQLPIGQAQSFRGVVDLVVQQAYMFEDGKVTVGPIPQDMQDMVATYRERLIEGLAEVDDDLMTKYLEGEELSDEEIRTALHTGVRSGALVPVLCGAATANRGIQPLLDAIVAYLPSPAERAEIEVIDPATGNTSKLQASEQGPLAVLVFKTLADPFVGKLSYFRVYSGTLRSDMHVWNATRQKDERIGQLFTVRGKTQEPTPQVTAGDIGAVAKLAETLTGDTLCSREHPLLLPPIKFPPPVFSAAIEPKTKADLDRLGPALARMQEEDPTIHVHRDPDTGQTIVSGLGEAHVEIMAERMKRKFGADVTVELPKVPYRETIRGKARKQGRFKRQTGGRGQYGDTWLRVEPLPRGAGYQFVDEIVGGVVPQQYRPAVDKGVQEAMAEGFLAGYPMVDIKVTLDDGSYHPVDSSEMAFKIAAAIGFKAAVAEADPVILEPIMKLDITAPDQYTGDIIGDLTAKRGRVLGMEPQGDGTTIIHAEAPMAEVLRYATDLRSITQGRGTFTMTLSHYEEVPPHIQQQLIEQAKKEKEAAAKAG
jgi:elongation factor G